MKRKKNNIAKQAQFLVYSILLFIFLYLIFFALGGILFWTSYILGKYKLVHGYLPYDLPTILLVVLLMGSVVLIYKMIQSLTAIQQINRPDLKEITRTEQPKLFQLIDEAANSVQVKPPQRVYLSATASASVFLQSGFWNVFRLSRKQLEIGTGLINVLNTEELRAVLIHELGHFSQKNMGLNVPVYVIGQSMRYLLQKVEIKKRGTFEAQSYVFIYIFRILSEWIFSKLSKDFVSFSAELEYNADAIALKHTGKEALVSALLKVSFASQLFDFTTNSLGILIQSGKKITDFYTAQHIVMNTFLQIRNNNWSDNFISVPLPDTRLSALSKKRIEKLQLSSESFTRSYQIVPASKILNNFEGISIRFTEDIYRHQFNAHVNDLVICNKNAYKRWVEKYFRQSGSVIIQPEESIDVEIIMEKPIAFESYWDGKRLGWYKRKAHIKAKTTVGKHKLKIIGEYLHETIFEIDIDKKKKYTVHLGRKLHFWKSVYTVWIEKIETD